MSVHANKSDDGKSLTICVCGEFSAGTYEEFRRVYKDKPLLPEQSCVVDLSKATAMDSTALGMLLMLKDCVTSDSCRFSVINCNHDIQKALTATGLDEEVRLQHVPYLQILNARRSWY